MHAFTAESQAQDHLGLGVFMEGGQRSGAWTRMTRIGTRNGMSTVTTHASEPPESQFLLPREHTGSLLHPSSKVCEDWECDGLNMSQ